MRRPFALFVVLAVVAAALAPPAFAKGTVGLRGGFALDPDDFVIGLHFRTDPLSENLYFVPSVEVGFGDATMIAGNADLHYVFNTDSKLKPYVGGGLTINWFDTDGGDSDTEFGGSILGGIKLTPKMFLEAKLGLGDVPDAKFLVGWNLR